MSIWKTPDVKPSAADMIIFYAGGGRFPYLDWYDRHNDKFGNWKATDVQKWARIDDLVDAANQVQAELDKPTYGSKEYRHLMYLKRKEKILAQSKAYRQAHPERVKAYNKKHRDQIREASKKWKEANKDRCREYQRLYKREYRKKLKETGDEK